MAKMTSTKAKEREFIIECIHLYRDLPVLWNMKCKEYHDRRKKDKAYDLLLEKYQELYPTATKEDLKKRFNSLRTNYRTEWRKCVASMNSDNTVGIYEPKLWYFHEMSFLQDDTSNVDYSMETVEKVECEVEETAEIQASTSYESEDSTVLVAPPKPLKKPTFKKAKKEEKFMNLVYEQLSEKKDEYDYWAMAFAADLRKMDQTQQIYAKKAIAEIIMEGQLGLLNRDSVKVN